MRFEKDIWEPTCREYEVTGLDTSYFNDAAKVVVSVWLERLTDFKAPVTRRLDRLCLLDLAEDLLRAIALWQTNEKTSYRVLLLLKEIAASLQRAHSTGVRIPGELEALRIQSIIPQFSEFVNASNTERDKLWPPIAKLLGRGAELNGGRPAACELFTREVVSLITTFRAFLRGSRAYMHALTSAFAECIEGTVDLGRTDHVVCELLAYSLRRGYSKEHLAELPIKYLRADNTKLDGKSLNDRVSMMLGAFGSSKQRYVVVLPLEGPMLAIDGNIFPEGIHVASPEKWHKLVAPNVLSELSNEDSARQAFTVDVHEALHYESTHERARPHDLFAARDLAVKAVRRCMDAVFLHRAAVPTLAGFALVSAREPDKDAFVRRIELERDHRPEKVSLRFLRAVPSEWVDALHWYREGREGPSDEVGLVNLWTAIELLSRRDTDVYTHDVDRVQKTVGALASVALMERELRYLAREVSTCIEVQTADSASLVREWIANKSDAEARTAFRKFPHLAEVICAAKASNYFATRLGQIQEFVRDKLTWAYGYRNDVVHEGRRGLPGASTARAVLADISEAAISLTITLESRSFASSLHECFQWARQQNITLTALSSQGDVPGLLARLLP
jgi:hypothetical protein